MTASASLQVQDIDFFSDKPFPSHDVITMGMILHDWGLEKKKLLMKKVSTGKDALHNLSMHRVGWVGGCRCGF